MTDEACRVRERDLTDLLLHGSDEQIRAAGNDPDRPKITAEEASERLRKAAREFSLSITEATAAIQAFGAAALKADKAMRRTKLRETGR